MNKKTVFLIVGALAIMSYAFYFTLGQYPGAEEANNTQKEFLVQAVYSDGTYENFAINTRKDTLGEALIDGKLIEVNEGENGAVVTTLNGVTAEESKDEWWCLTKNGESVPTAIDATPIANDDHFELTLTIGQPPAAENGTAE